jgi:hypothetical protein
MWTKLSHDNQAIKNLIIKALAPKDKREALDYLFEKKQFAMRV